MFTRFGVSHCLALFALFPFAACASVGAEGAGADGLSAVGGPSKRMTVGIGRTFTSGDVSPSEELKTLGVELSSDAGLGSLGFEVGLARSGAEIDESNPLTGLSVDGDIDLTEMYVGLRKAIKLGLVEAHLGLGVSYVDLGSDVGVSLPLTSRANGLDGVPVDDSTVGGYVQAGAYLPVTDWFGVGLAGRFREGPDFEEDGRTADGSFSTLGLTLHLFR